MNNRRIFENKVNYSLRSAMQGALFHILLFSPGLIMISFNRGSFASGLAIYFYLLIVYVAARNPSISSVGQSGIRRPIFFAAFLFIILIHAIFAAIINPYFEYNRFAASYLLLLVMCACALAYTPILLKVSLTEVSRWVNIALWFLVVNAVIGLTGFDLFQGGLGKPVGIFLEPSHFALILAPLLAFTSATKAKNAFVFHIFFILWGLAIENLTTLITVALSASLVFRLKISLKIIKIIFFIMILVAVFAQEINFMHFLDRISISADSDNLSVLVLLQGWQNAFVILRDTGGWGSGFQQFGFFGSYGDIQTRILELAGVNLNLFDGGSTAAKLIGEFGVFGMAAVSIFLAIAVQSFFFLRSRTINENSGGSVLLSVSVFAFTIELFVRGVGYFSPTSFLALCGLVKFFCYNKKIKRL